MKRIAFVYYRSWAHDILNDIISLQAKRGDFEISVIVTSASMEFDPGDDLAELPVFGIDPRNTEELVDILDKSEAELVFFFSWSWIVPDELISDKICLCLHPSKLPAFRGGSPIQNQIFSGVEDSAVSVLRMTKELDGGPLYRQAAISLTGDIEEIFARMSSVGKTISKDLIADYINDELSFSEQPSSSESTTFRRRKPSESELDLDGILNTPFASVSKFVGALRDPYPNAHISRSSDKILVREILQFKKLPGDGFVVTSNNVEDVDLRMRLFFQVSDGFALISERSLTNT